MAKKSSLLTLAALLIITFSQAQNLIAYYPFNGNANDASGNGYDGTLYNGAAANDTLLIGDNNLDYVTIPDSIINGLTDLTVSFKFKFNTIHSTGSFPANTMLHAWGGNSDQDDLKISYDGPNSQFQVSVLTNEVTFPFTALANVWYCVSIVRAGTAVTLYIGGDVVGTLTLPNNGAFNVASNGFVFGQEQDCVGGCFAANQSLAGEIDELKFYDYALSSDLLTRSCQSCPLGLFYPFSINAADSSGNFLDGILQGGATITNSNLSIGDNDVDYVSVPNTALNSVTDFQIHFGAKFNLFHESGQFPANTVLHAWGTSNEDELKISYDDLDQLFQVSVKGVNYTWPMTLQANTWFCFDVARNYDSLRLYLNGNLQGDPILVSSTGLTVAANGVVMGQEEDCDGGCFAQNQSLAGHLDNFTIKCPAPIQSQFCDVATGSIETSISQFEVYPNPADKNISVVSAALRNARVRILNELGQEVLIASQKNSSSVILSTENLDEGIYLVEVWNESERVYTQKIILTH